jgi:ABC-2 type transport system ATP-binding protein
MKIITCYIPPTEGSVKVCGYDINDNSIEVRKHVGYLPEHNPLYLDMFVKEYLEFIGRLHHLKNLKDRVKEMIELTGLQVEQNKKIGALSKGYRQRVGIAQALIHDPKVLILDEPTTGLDPNQLAEIRNLIKKIGKQKTVMLSTHIMQEVEAVCDKVIIINKGKIVANAPASQIQNLTGNRVQLIVEFDKALTKSQLLKINGIAQVENSSGNTWILESVAGKDVRNDVFKFAVDNELTVLTLQKNEQKLEDVFKELTKKSV